MQFFTIFFENMNFLKAVAWTGFLTKFTKLTIDFWSPQRPLAKKGVNVVFCKIFESMSFQRAVARTGFLTKFTKLILLFWSPQRPPAKEGVNVVFWKFFKSMNFLRAVAQTGFLAKFTKLIIEFFARRKSRGSMNWILLKRFLQLIRINESGCASLMLFPPVIPQQKNSNLNPKFTKADFQTKLKVMIYTIFQPYFSYILLKRYYKPRRLLQDPCSFPI